VAGVSSPFITIPLSRKGRYRLDSLPAFVQCWGMSSLQGYKATLVPASAQDDSTRRRQPPPAARPWCTGQGRHSPPVPARSRRAQRPARYQGSLPRRRASASRPALRANGQPAARSCCRLGFGLSGIQGRVIDPANRRPDLRLQFDVPDRIPGHTAEPIDRVVRAEGVVHVLCPEHRLGTVGLVVDDPPVPTEILEVVDPVLVQLVRRPDVDLRVLVVQDVNAHPAALTCGKVIRRPHASGAGGVIRAGEVGAAVDTWIRNEVCQRGACPCDESE
jgi:hypothetical protein